MVFSQHVRRSPIEIWRTPGRKAPPATRVPQRLISSSQNDGFFDFQSGRASSVFTQSGRVWPSCLTVSPDEQRIVRHQHSMPQAELMLVENFR